MHVTSDRRAVQKLMEDTIKQMKGRTAPGARATEIKAAPKRTEGRKPGVEFWEGALANLKKRSGEGKGVRAAGLRAAGPSPGRAVETPYAPRDQKIALFQSAMDQYLKVKALDGDEGKSTTTKLSARGLRGKPPVAHTLAAFYKAPKKGGKRGARATELAPQFSPLDPRWIEVVTEKAKLLFRGKRRFVSHASSSDFQFRMGNQATIAIVGDWGGGNAAAQAVAKQIAKLAPDHVVHLGDVYYAGTPEEVRNRFLKYWPKPKEPGKSFALNSNHEMYSGGYGYFDSTLKTFGQPASYFSLANDHWRFLGIDTGYDEHDLHPPQAEWIAAQLSGGTQKTVLLSHHQLYSAYEDADASKLASKAQPFLSQIYGWIWGHEHLAVVYEPREGLRAVCLGNGCFPYNFPTAKPSIPIKWIDTRQSTDPDWVGGHTFALLKFNGPQIDIDYMDENGQVGFSDQWA